MFVQVNYKSDLNWIKGVGWTPPGSHKAELARRAAELGLAEGCSTDEAIAKYQQMMMVSCGGVRSPGCSSESLPGSLNDFPFLVLQVHRQQMMEQQMMEQQLMEQQQESEQVETSEEVQQGVNMDAMEVLHVKRKKTIQTVQKKSTTTTSSSSSSFKSMEKKSSSAASNFSSLQSAVKTSNKAIEDV